MSEVIKSWSFIEARKYNSQVELFHDRVLVHSQLNNTIQTYSFDEVLISSSIIGNLLIDYSILKYIAILAIPQQLSTLGQRAYFFYQSFDDASKVQPDDISFNQEDQQLFKSINKNGLEQYYENQEGIFIQSRQRFDHFFFEGPLMANLPIDTRREWRRKVWASLLDPRPFQLEDGFVIFDYEKLDAEDFEVDGAALVSASVNRGVCTIDNSSLAHSKKNFTVEQLWYNEALWPVELEDHKKAFYQKLKEAIVEGDKDHPYLVSLEKASNPNKFQMPGEAPPA